MSAPRVTALVVNWNTRELLIECLESLGRQETGYPVQIVVIDNASDDGSVSCVRERFPGAVLLAESENIGFVAANNRGAAHADPASAYFLLINADASLDAGALPRLVDFLDSHPKAAMCGPLLRNTDGTLQISWSRFPTVTSELRGVEDRRFARGISPELTLDSLRGRDDTPEVDWLSGACLLVRRSAVHGTLFDPAFHMYSEETDLSFRARVAGYSVHLIPRAGAVHHYGQSSAQAPTRTIRLLYESKLKFFRKHYGPVYACTLRLGIATLALLKICVYGLLSLSPRDRKANRLRSQRQWAVLRLMCGLSPKDEPGDRM